MLPSIKQPLLWLSAVVLVLVAGTAPARAQGKSRKPNIIILLADDMGYADVGFQGCKDIPTPNINTLAKNGVRFSSGYVSGPYCSPTRAGLLTGRYQTRFGHEFNPGAGKKPGLPVEQTTMASMLAMFGYVTGLVGKWHLGSGPKMHPTERLSGVLRFPGWGALLFSWQGRHYHRGTKQTTESVSHGRPGPGGGGFH